MRLRRTVLIWAAVAALVAGACGDNGEDLADDAGDTVTTLTPGDDTAEPAGEPDGGTTVQVADNPDFGPILVGPNGHTLYLFERDEGTTTACTGGCASAWPALAASGEPTAGDGADASLLSTADAQVPNHVAYNGHLLYFYAQDNAPGDVNGINVEAWFPVSPEGDKVEGSSS